MQDAPYNKRATEGAGAPLPDDMLLEILVRVKDVPTALVRCATACKRWRGLVADPFLLRRYWPPGSSSYSFEGFFTEKLRHGEAPVNAPCFVPAPRSALGRGRRTLRSFIPSTPGGLFDGAVPVTSRHGLLLVRLTSSPETTRLVVCNLLTGTCDLLPCLTRHHSSYRFAILTGADYPLDRTMSYFKVVAVDMWYRLPHHVYMISSDEASWSHTSSGRVDDAIIKDYKYDAIVWRGMVHWIGYNHTTSCLCTIDVNAETGHVSKTKFLADMTLYQSQHYGDPCLSLAVDGGRTLSMLCMQTEYLEIEIWERQDNKGIIHKEDDDDDHTSTWHCTRVIELEPPPDMKIGRIQHILGEKCGTLLVNDNFSNVYCIQLETGIMEEVMDCHWDYLSQGEAVAFEMDWLAFFVSRLGSW